MKCKLFAKSGLLHIAAAVAIASLVAATTRATDYVWDNWSGDNSFNNSQNWLPVAVPGSSDSAIFQTDLASDSVDVSDGTNILVMRVVDTAIVDMTIGDGTTSSRFDLDQMSGDSLVVGDSAGDTAELNLLGGWLDTYDASIGGRAIFNLIGEGTYWDSTDVLVSGDTVANTAGIGLGLQARINTQGNLDIGSDTGSGRVAVEGTGLGAGALWTVTGSVDVGPSVVSGFNFGQLTLRLGGRMSVDQDLDVHGAEAASTVTVQTGGDLDVTGLFQVGQYGVLELFDPASSIATGDIDVDGTFNWTGGTLHVTDSRVRIDDSQFADLGISNLTIGAGQELIVSNPNGNIGNVTVGNVGAGTLTIEAGGRVETTTGVIGEVGGSNGTVTVDGSSSVLTCHNNLHVGGTYSVAGGTGTLTVRNGGRVDVSNTLRTWGGGTVELLGSEINTGSFINSYGGTFTHDDGTLTVNGGDFAPVQNGTTYRIDGADADDLPTVVLDSATTTVQPSQLRLGSSNYGSLALRNGSTMTINGDAYLAYYSTAEGYLTVDGVGSMLTVTGDLEVGDGRTGFLTIAGGGVVNSSGVGSGGRDVIGDDPGTGNGAVSVHGDGSSWQTDTLVVGERGLGILDIGVSSVGGTVTTYGHAFISRYVGSAGSQVTVADGSWNVNNGIVWIGGGTNADGAGDTALLTVEAGGLVTTMGGYDIKVWGPGEVHLDNGTIEVGNDLNLASGALTGYGTVDGDVANNGRVALTAPISGAGDLEITGDYAQVSGTLEIEIGGALPGQYDRLLIGGSAALDATLDVALISLGGGSPYDPVLGDTFEILSAAGGVNGTFATEALPPLASGLFWHADYDTNLLALDVLPLGDVNRDGQVNGLDVGPFVDLVVGGFYDVAADVNEDGVVDGLDVEPFVDLVVGGGAEAVPEPSTVLLAALGLFILLTYGSARGSRR